MDRTAAPELLADTIFKDIQPYALKVQMSLDDFFVSYCMELLDNAGKKCISPVHKQKRFFRIMGN